MTMSLMSGVVDTMCRTLTSPFTTGFPAAPSASLVQITNPFSDGSPLATPRPNGAAPVPGTKGWVVVAARDEVDRSFEFELVG